MNQSYVLCSFIFHSYIHDIIRFAPRMMKRTPAMSPNEHLSPIAGQFPWRLAHGCSSMFIPKYQNNYTQTCHLYCHECCLLLLWLKRLQYIFIIVVTVILTAICQIYIYTYTHTYIYTYIYIYHIYIYSIYIICIQLSLLS